ncbi:MAG TPA: hypothetical protein VM935_05405 [Chitinophagaceae bacterium]|jgi:hypothetical protein|nr:hypothetical protein [Chitinophagaceae bacterium]
MTSYLWYLTWGLLPLIPAILLYKVFPTSKAEISTPGYNDTEANGDTANKPAGSWGHKLTGGFALKLSGAVAVYFIVLYLMNPAKNGYFIPSHEKEWQLKTSFVDTRGNLIPFKKIKAVEMIPDLTIREDIHGALVTLGKFQEKENKLTIPFSLRFLFDGYEAASIPLVDSLQSKTYCEKKSDLSRIDLKPIIVKTNFVDTTSQETEFISERKIN